MTNVSLEERSALFATDIQTTLDGTLPGSRQVVSYEAEGVDRYVVTLEEPKMALYVDKQVLAHLSFSLDQELDRSGKHLKTSGSKVTVWSSVDRNPLVRLEYRADMHSDPICHWQVHAERGAMSHLLGIANLHSPKRVRKPHDYSTLHFPVGGERFRPCLEDVLQFLIVDCGIDHHGDWQARLDDGRERWRRLQLRSAVRDIPAEAAMVLEQLGWTVTPPSLSGAEHVEPLRKW